MHIFVCVFRHVFVIILFLLPFLSLTLMMMPMMMRIIPHIFSASYMLEIKTVPPISSGMKVLKRPGINR